MHEDSKSNYKLPDTNVKPVKNSTTTGYPLGGIPKTDTLWQN
ncbi:Putative protein [Zobellia galactanivorans]|uniref:Uncharacterized protein n=1 Tax=Zobellia galactanivorans (strain DSM 12802 / CCUG 47099 / CIP 106680 / NCIMB 13871 / Dsij) TaxID=63186 RepID=G0LA94_ZOBGA|nr:Putative protein [Zobellia galactanivorans]